MLEINLKILKGSLTFCGSGKFFAAPKNVEKGETLISRPGDKHV